VAPAELGAAPLEGTKMKVSEDYAGKTMSAKWLATTLKNHNKRELEATIESVRKHQYDPKEPAKYVVKFVGKEMEAVVNKTNAFALANDLGDDTSDWPGNKIVLSTSWGQTPTGMGDIMHMRGIRSDQKPANKVPRLEASSQGSEPKQGNGAANAYAAASQPANSEQPNQGGNADADLNDEIPF